ncbi:uncharacterized protein [Procambarus clarkii]|nr:uncharacterized protein LOC123770330 isoform X3 [Procambarus clarkii]XP_045618073.1 uncharacterized protein LOC123770330 isoform X3 [Procambarus clarkii]XP_045618074.1 uncharacterized protein LOC123770330 isoform X3 [Procambarus clarkii]XP_045618075.1 uncharacterized protein LOC123770330 isoform X3 [Procambarus clarkii]XP_045618076.1 uncharacterized protein LOC123770330 isoform X3 [Procambarus clarkii]XP_045618077.1 uncharacterized protein LOC123770330 isoform X3 [Procambarus clarkii]
MREMVVMVVMVMVMVVMGPVGVVAPVPLPHPTPRPDLLALTQDYWHWKTQDFPQFATTVGINDNTAGRLDSYSLDHFQHRKSKCEEFLRRAEEIDVASLSEDDLVNLKIFKQEMIVFLENAPFIKYFTPVTFMGGPQRDFKLMVEKKMVLNSYNDYQKLLSRYGEFPRQAQEIIELMKGNIEDGLMPSNWSLVGVVDQLDKLGGPVEDSVFYKPFLHTPSTVTPEQRTTLRHQAQERIKQDLLPAFKRIRDFIETDYLPATRPEIAVSSLEGGQEFYQACLKFHTSTNLTPQEIHNLGVTEVARIEEEVLKTAVEIQMEGKTFSEISQALKKDPEQSFSSKEELLSTYRNAAYNVIIPLMPRLFINVPQDNVTIEGDDNPNAVFGMYSSPSLDGSRLGIFTINSYIYDKHKKYEVTALTLHETMPGHHLHKLYMRVNPSTPNFRKFVDPTRTGDAPSRFPLHTVFSEGWGLYSEFLGEELGLYQDPYQRIGRYSFELLRASRLVVDTGMHALGWSRERAVAFLLDHTALSKEALQIEVNRYITLPGQACSYKIGEIKIKELRQKAQNALGGLFHLPEFHDVVLRCTGPLKILEECVTNYIERKILVIERVTEEKKEDELIQSDTAEDNGSTNPSSKESENEIMVTIDGAASIRGDKSAVILTVSILSFLPYLLR